MCGDFAELFEGAPRHGPRLRPGPGSESPERSQSRDDDFLGEDIGIREIVGLFQAFVSEPEDVEAGFITLIVPFISNYFAL
jgi:hypothetical protein